MADSSRRFKFIGVLGSVGILSVAGEQKVRPASWVRLSSEATPDLPPRHIEPGAMIIRLGRLTPGYFRLLQRQVAGEVQMQPKDRAVNQIAMMLAIMGLSLSYYSAKQMMEKTEASLGATCTPPFPRRKLLPIALPYPLPLAHHWMKISLWYLGDARNRTQPFDGEHPIG
ncbi:unnamed protein product [Pleuronectes platessa]|uniref:Uncharacterized protein n=1 Tax=Pleuronectes platessa TaxID=8262 RepID=A0A9N7Y1X8_PLEPL|nr:unnamed protein product [Pleuronectes platessa]